MNEYTLVELDRFYLSFESLLLYRAEYSKESASHFKNKAFEWIELIGTFPFAGRVFWEKYRTKVISGCLIIYRVDELQKKIFIMDIFDPKQDTEAEKYH